MRFLLTGGISNFTDRSYNANRSRLGVFTTTDGLISALEEMGHTVTCKYVIPGEDLSMYDNLIVGLSSLFNNMALHTPGVYWALSKFKNPILTVNDWRVLDAMKMVKADVNKNDNFFTTYVKSNNKQLSSANKVEDYFKLVTENLDAIIEAKQWFDSAEHLPLLFPAYSGFNREKLKVNNPVFPWNPSEFMPQKSYVANSLFSEKEEVHLIASTSTPKWSWFKNLDPAWTSLEEIEKNSTFKIQAFGNWNKNAVKEKELVSIMADATTCIVPSYSQIAGVGMWRPRHVICNNVDTLVLCDKEEGSFMGEGYGQHSAKEIEAMTESQREDLLEIQKESFKKSGLDKEGVFEQINKVI